MRRYVLFADICSSTTIIENLISNERQSLYSELVEGLYRIFENGFDARFSEIHKFLGDGFIVLISNEVSADSLFGILMNVCERAERHVSEFVERNVDAVVSKVGMTYGLTIGNISELSAKVFSSREYFGRPLNLAARFQSSVTDANTMIIQKEIYNSLENQAYKRICTETTRSFKNISNDAEVRCYNAYPQAFLTEPFKKLMSLIETSTTSRRHEGSADLAEAKKKVDEIVEYIKKIR